MMQQTKKRKALRDDLARRIGNNLKAFRKDAGLSQKHLAEAVDLSSTLISRIENGFMRPSLATLELIANSLRVDIGYFFRDEEETRFTVSFKVKRKSAVSGKGYDRIEFLAERMDTAFMDPVIVSLKGKDHESEVELAVHDGQEFMFVLEGKIELTLGTKKYVLQEEDAAYWHGDIPHKGVSLSKKPARTMNVHLIPGKRMGTFKSLDD